MKCWPASCRPAPSRGLANAQLLYTLPVSLFGLSVSAAALPAMSGAVGLDAIDVVRDRVNTGLRQIAFFVVPSAVAFLALGDVVAAALFQTGRFTYGDAVYVWGILAGSSIGLLATTLARLYSSTYYALRDTRTPLRYALVHVGVATRARVLRGDRPAAAARDRSGLGHRRLDDSRQHWRMGRADVAAPIAESAHRPDGLAPRSRRAPVERRLRCRRSRMGHQARAARGASDSAGGADSCAVRCCVSRIDAGVREWLRRGGCLRACR